MKKIRTGDEVIVIAGRDKGKRGAVMSVFGSTLKVEGVNLLTEFVKGDPERKIKPSIDQRPGSVHRSNVMLYNAATKKGDKVGIRTLENGRKVRYFKSNDEVIDVKG